MTGAAPDITTGAPQRVLVVGVGLVGASIGLALSSAGVDVGLRDRDPRRQQLAVDLGAGRPYQPGDAPADLVVVAVPPAATAAVLIEVQRLGLGSSFTDVASVKTHPLDEVKAMGGDLGSLCAGHPVAGSERSGPAAARADLFAGRLWVITPTPQTSPAAVGAVEWLARTCGAQPVRMAPVTHDEVFARLSHVPQLAASALASLTLDLEPEEVALAGPGLRDVLRIAGSAPDLWAQIVTANAGPVAAALRGVVEPLAALADLLDPPADGGGAESAAAAVRALVAAGNAGYARLPGKHGGAPSRFATLGIVVRDQPGELARLLTEAAAAGINVEDIRVDHSPGQPVGLAELAVAPGLVEPAVAALTERGWTVHREVDIET